MRVPVLFLLAVVGTTSSGCGAEPQGPKPREEGVVPLPPEQQLIRVSMALRGTRPSVDDLDRVRQDPLEVVSLAEEYASSELFVETTKDLFAEVLRMRSVTLTLPTSVGRDDELVLGTTREMKDALAEESLNLIAEVVRQDLPFSEIVTADWTVLDPLGAQVWDGHDYDTSLGGLQIAHFVDGRPPAGILATSSFLLRHESNGRNHNRGRASIVSEALLCDSYAERDIPIEGDLSDPEAIADAVNREPACVACHQSVDPVAASFIPFRPRVQPNQVNRDHEEGCGPDARSCYPLQMYFGEYADHWQSLGLRAPGYFGEPVADLSGVGQGIAEDARFSQCMARRFAAYLTQRDLGAIPAAEVASLQQVFLDSDLSVRAVAVAVVTDPAFLAATVTTAEGTMPTELQILRPEQLDRLVTDLTGLRLEARLGGAAGDIPLLRDDLLGFRSMSGGVDGDTISQPTHLPTPTRLLTLAMVAEEAAGHVVSQDFDAPAAERMLLRDVDATTTNEAAVRQALVAVHRRLFGRSLDAQSTEIDDAHALWQTVASANGSEAGWKAVLAALLQSPDILFY